jgi:hypothetical protein
MRNSHDRLSWTDREKKVFQDAFEGLRLACFAAPGFGVEDIEDHDSQDSVELLHQFIREGEKCPICLEGGNVDSIAICSHIFCIGCYADFVNHKVQEFEKAQANGEPVGEVLAITCPLCPTILGHWSTHLSATMSTKSRWIINKVRELLNELENETKVVVISSCPPNLTWFSRAFTGLQIPTTHSMPEL